MTKFNTRILLRFTPIRRTRIQILTLTRPLRSNKRSSTISFNHTPRTNNRHLRITSNNIQITRASKFRSFLYYLSTRSSLIILRLNISQRRQTVMSIRIRITCFTTNIIMLISRFFQIRTRYTNRSTRLLILIRLIRISITLLFRTSSQNPTRIQRRIHTLRKPSLLTVFRRTLRTMILKRTRNLLTQSVTTFKRTLRQIRHITNTRQFINTTICRLRRLRNRFRVTRATTTRLGLTILRKHKGRVLRTLTRFLTIMSRILTLKYTPRRQPNRIRMNLARIKITNRQTNLRRHLRLPVLNPLLVVILIQKRRTRRHTILTFQTRTTISLPRQLLNRTRSNKLTSTLWRNTRLNTRTGRHLVIRVLINQFSRMSRIRIKSMIRFLYTRFTRTSSNRTRILTTLNFITNSNRHTFRHHIHRIKRFTTSNQLSKNQIIHRNVLNSSNNRLIPMTKARNHNHFNRVLKNSKRNQFIQIHTSHLRRAYATLHIVRRVTITIISYYHLRGLQLRTRRLTRHIKSTRRHSRALRNIIIKSSIFRVTLTKLRHISSVRRVTRYRVKITNINRHTRRFNTSLVKGIIHLRLIRRNTNLIRILRAYPSRIRKTKFRSQQFRGVPLCALVPSR